MPPAEPSWQIWPPTPVKASTIKLLHLSSSSQKIDYQGKQHHKETITQIHNVGLLYNKTVLDSLKSQYYEGKMESG